MTKESKTAKASAVKAAPKPKAVLTAEQAVSEIRKLRAGNLFVSNMEYVDKLLEAHDRLAVLGLDAEAALLRKEAELRAKHDRMVELGGEIASALALLHEHLTARYATLDDALRNMLQAFINYRDLVPELEAKVSELRAARESRP